MKPAPAKVISIGLHLAILALGATVGYQLFGGEEHIPAEAAIVDIARAAVEPFQPAERPPFPAIASVAVISARPLFSETRRPPEPPPSLPREDRSEAPPPPPQVTLGQFRLSGIVEFQGLRHAILKHEDDDGIIRIREGQTVRDWRVESIDYDAVVLTQRGVQDVVRLRDNEAEESLIRQRALEARRAAVATGEEPQDRSRRVRSPASNQPDGHGR